MNEWKIIKSLMIYKWHKFEDHGYSYYELSEGSLIDSLIRITVVDNTLVELIPKNKQYSNRIKKSLLILVLKLLEEEKIKVESVIIAKDTEASNRYTYAIGYKSERERNSIKELSGLIFKHKFNIAPFRIASKTLKISKIEGLDLRNYPTPEEAYLTSSDKISLPENISKIIFNGGSGLLVESWSHYKHLDLICFYNVIKLQLKSLMCSSIEIRGPSREGIRNQLILNNDTKIKRIFCNWVNLKISGSGNLLIDSLILNDSSIIGCRNLEIKRVHIHKSFLTLKNNKLKFLSIDRVQDSYFVISSPLWELSAEVMVLRFGFFRKKEIPLIIFYDNISKVEEAISTLSRLGTDIINLEHSKFSFRESSFSKSQSNVINKYLAFLTDLKLYQNASEVKNLAPLILMNADKDKENLKLINDIC